LKLIRGHFTTASQRHRVKECFQSSSRD